MTISTEGIHDLAYWARSKACNGWRHDGVRRDKDTGEPLQEPHPGASRRSGLQIFSIHAEVTGTT